MRIVALIGPKSAGKDTVADLLKESKLSNGKLSFAGPLKEMLSQVFGIPMQLFNDPDLKELVMKNPITLTPKTLREIKNRCTELVDPYDGSTVVKYNANRASIAGLEGRTITTPRELMQLIGTEYIRNRIYKNFHIEAACSDERLAKLAPKSGLFLVSDVRFVNEFEYLRDKFGEQFGAFYIERPEAEAKLAAATHDSELDVTKIKSLLTEDQIINNSGSLADLKKVVTNLKLPEESKNGQPKKSRFKFTTK